MYANDVPVKPRRKNLEVPVHRRQDNYEKSPKRTETSLVRKHKHRSSERYEKSPYSSNQDIPSGIRDENRRNINISKKQLWKENFRLEKEKEEVISKFNELEDLSLKKITKLREKIIGLQNDKSEFQAENSNLKVQFDNLVVEYEDLKQQLELCKVCHGCEEYKLALDNVGTENSYLRKSKRELSEDLDMMKTVVFRLNLQLERYQEKLRNKTTPERNSKFLQHIPDVGTGDFHPQQNFQENHSGHQHFPISWGRVNTHTLGPLLEAFQDTINEKDEIIQEYETEFSNFTSRLKEIMAENERLHERLTEDDQCSTKLREEVDNIRVELANTKEQNDILIKKCSTKQDKIEEIFKCYEAKVEQLKRDYNVLHEQYYKSRTDSTSLNEKNKALQHSLEEMKNEKKDFIPISVHTASVNECKKWYEELKSQYEKEKDKMKQTLEDRTKEIGDLHSKMNEIQIEKHDRDEKIKQYEKHIRKWEAKYLELEQTLNAVKVSKTACKKQLHKAMTFAKDLVTEQESLLKALNQRQEENKVVTEIGAEMASKMDNLKSQLKEVQRGAWQELNSVEGKIQEQEETIEQMKEEYNKEIVRLESIIRRQSDEAAVLKTQSKLPISPYSLYRDKIQN